MDAALQGLAHACGRAWEVWTLAPDWLRYGALALIAADVAALSREAIRLGATGIFFAHQDTDRSKVDADIFFRLCCSL